MALYHLHLKQNKFDKSTARIVPKTKHIIREPAKPISLELVLESSALSLFLLAADVVHLAIVRFS